MVYQTRLLDMISRIVVIIILLCPLALWINGCTSQICIWYHPFKVTNYQNQTITLNNGLNTSLIYIYPVNAILEYENIYCFISMSSVNRNLSIIINTYDSYSKF